MSHAPLSSSSPSLTRVALKELPADGPVEDIVAELERSGGVILSNFISSEHLQRLNVDVAREISKRPPHTSQIEKFPYLAGLVGKSKAAAAVCELPVVTKLLNSFLTHRFFVRREEETEEVAVPPLLSLSASLYLSPGPPRAKLHRDDLIHGIDHSGSFDIKNQTELACLIAGADTTMENGATLFIPGSHRWDDERIPKLEEACYAEMKAGSAFLYLGSCYHASGHNSIPGTMRMVHGFYFIRGTLRPEENQFLAVPRKAVLSMSDTLLSLLGYKCPPVPLGILDATDAAKDLRSVFLKNNA